MNIPPEQFAKLPKYAQMELDRLERNVEFYREKLEAGPDKSDTFMSTGASGYKPLGEGERIFFLMRTNGAMLQDSIVARVETDHKGRHYLDVHGSEGIVISPQASNGIRIYLQKF